MGELEKFNKTKEVVAKFNNGEKLYQESALFNQVVQMLVREVDVYEVIEQLIIVTGDSQEALKQQIHNNPPHLKTH